VPEILFQWISCFGYLTIWRFCYTLCPLTCSFGCCCLLFTANKAKPRRMVSSGMLRCVALVRTDVSEELSASIIRVTIGELGTALAVTSNRRTLRRNTKCCSQFTDSCHPEVLSSSETSVLTRATRRNTPEDTILHSHRRENLKSYKAKPRFIVFFCCPE
jgi:hypothetical protein